MIKQRTFAITIAALTLTACAQTASQVPTRLETNPLGFHGSVLASDGITEQARALTAQADAIVRASTVKGAVLGAAIGCGVSVVLASDASKCIAAAAVGAAGGAIVGNRAGKRDVQRRIEIASPNALVRNLRKANDNLTSIQASLPDLLARQDAELNALSLSFAANQMSQQAHDAKVAAIRNDRAELSQALLMTAQQAKQAAANLRTASDAGHSGLEWHIAATDQLARDTLSSRSTISLL